MDLPGYEVGETIHVSRLRAIHRAVRLADGAPVVLKTLLADFPSRREIAELRREFQITQRLQRVSRVIEVYELVSWGDGNLAIVMEPFGISLAQHLEQRDGEPLPLHRFLPIAINICRTLGAVHQQSVVHKDLVPRNVLLDPKTDDIRLIDFGISSELSLERQDGNLGKRLEGSLPYISPEQTGRMNRDLDYRSDYYSLGVTFFELLTGRLPFLAETVLEWVHSHIGKAPPSPSSVDPDVPLALSRIVLKLMSKNAKDRYQSTYGLIADLEHCQQEVEETGFVQPFELGLRDVSQTFGIPQKLYGREEELRELLALFEAAADGESELCLVSGYSGVGKSALVNEISKPLVRRQGYLIQGKFDQFQRNEAYSAFASALGGLVEQLLAEPTERLDAWRESLKQAVGPNGRLLTDLVPGLELILGEQPPVPQLPPTEAQNRFGIVFSKVVRVFARREHPLVVFLDDLQWSDAPTLNLIHRLVTARDMRHLLLIGAYRSNEVDAGHPLRTALNEIAQSRPVQELPLQPLGRASVRDLVTDTLGGDRARCAPLADLLFDKAEGNPFFTTELLKNLHEDGVIAFDPQRGRWGWDLDAVRRAGITGNVAEFMVASLRKLPPDTQRVLQLAACIGSAFDLRTLAIIYERSMDEAGERLLEALKRHVVVPLSDQYRFVGQGTGGGQGADNDAPDNLSYRFQHDRIQQAAYALIDADRKQAVHLSVGRLIQGHTDPERLDERLIDVVGHLNEARELIVDPVERRELAELNLRAGRKAQRSSAYEQALGYLDVGRELLPGDPWADDYALMLALSTERQQCAYLTGRYGEAEQLIEEMLARARTPVDQAELLSMRTRQYSTIGRMHESMQAAIQGLNLLGVPVSEDPSSALIAQERAAVARHLGDRAIADLIDAPTLSSPSELIAIRLLMEIFPAAFLSGSGNLFPYLVLKSVNLSLQHGNSPESAFAYAAYGMLLCGALDDPALGSEYGRLAVAMNERLDDIGLKSRVIYVYTMFIHHWSNHWSSMTPWFKRGIEAGYQSGDLLYLAYSAQDCIIWDPRLDLETASRQQREYLGIVKDTGYQDSYDSGSLFLQMQLNFQGRTDDLCSMNDESFDEQTCVDGMRARRFMTGIANYQIYKAEICWLYGETDDALRFVRLQEPMSASSMSLPQLVRFVLVAFLTRAACLPSMPKAERADAQRRMADELKQMTRWAQHCPANFKHLQLLMEAEQARLAGNRELAFTGYDRAIDAAHASGFQRDEAMANELAARFLLEAGRTRAAEGYLRAAWQLYERWGAVRKVAQLETQHPVLTRHLGRGATRTVAAMTTTDSTIVDNAAMDMASVMKASRAIAGEIMLDQLWKTTIQILLENAGGQMGCFVVRRDGQLLIEVRGEVAGNATETGRSIVVEADAETPVLPLSILNNALRTRSPVVLNDASEASRFANDPYIVARQPRSVMCIPLLGHGKFEGAIYMENNLATGVFTEARVEVLKLLSAQATVSIENAELYEAQVRLTEAQRRFVPSQFLESLDHHDIARVGLGEHVAKEMSVMFADLRGFTTLSEHLEPRATIELLNRYFVSLEKPIAEAGGFIDSFAGDEIMALFEVSADRAVQAGVGMARALEEFNRRSASAGGPQLRAGIGVNTGPLVLGTVGGHERIQCTVIGDTVNLASRIEQLTKVYDARFLVGEHTVESLQGPDRFSLRRVDRVAVKGKERPVNLYEVLDAESTARRAAKEATRGLLDEAMARYLDWDFASAARLFTEGVRRDPQDPVFALFQSRAVRYEATPPPVDWQGFESLTSK